MVPTASSPAVSVYQYLYPLESLLITSSVDSSAAVAVAVVVTCQIRSRRDGH